LPVVVDVLEAGLLRDLRGLGRAGLGSAAVTSSA